MGCVKSREKTKTEGGRSYFILSGHILEASNVSPISKVRLALLKAQCDLLIKQKNSVRHDGTLL